MRVIRAAAMGMCFGVRDAIDRARSESAPDTVTVLGELVHNEAVLDELGARGFSQISESAHDRTPSTDRVLITAHGVSDAERGELRRRGKELIDTTCPLVHRAHDAARSLEKAGYHVIVIGQRDHVEVRGLVGDLESFSVIGGVDEVIRWPSSRLGVICQTTTRPELAAEIVAAIEERNPLADVRHVDTICSPTRDRQVATEALIGRVDVLVVVGGKNSNNTRQLARLAESRGVPSHHVQGPRDLRPEWFREGLTVGLTAGTSTLDETIDAVHAALEEIAADCRAPAFLGEAPAGEVPPASPRGGVSRRHPDPS